MTTRHCVVCGAEFQAHRSFHRYCGRKCSSLAGRRKGGIKLEAGRFCRQCGTKFFPAMNQQNKQHCSDECSKTSARESRSKFWAQNKDEKHKKYRDTRRAKVGPDGNLKRYYAKYPDAPKECESCGENRVLDIAHKPSYKRNGAWRSAKNTTPNKVWILCPTCHTLLDRMHYEPKELGLSEQA